MGDGWVGGCHVTQLISHYHCAAGPHMAPLDTVFIPPQAHPAPLFASNCTFHVVAELHALMLGEGEGPGLKTQGHSNLFHKHCFPNLR